MPDYKIDYIFNGPKGGWIETFYATYTTPQNALNGSFNIAKYRTAMLANGNRMVLIRASDVAIRGDSNIDDRCIGLLPLIDLGDINAAGALVRLEATARHRRGYIVRGMPDDWIAFNGIIGAMDLTAAGRVALQIWLNNIAGQNGFQLRVKARRGENTAPGGAPIEAPVLLFASGDARSTSTAVTVTGLDLDPVPGDIIYFAAARKTAAAINGAWPVISTSEVDGDRVINIPLVWGKISYAIPRDYVKCVGYLPTIFFPVIGNAIYERVTTRKTGRPFGQSAGRSRPRLR